MLKNFKVDQILIRIYCKYYFNPFSFDQNKI